MRQITLRIREETLETVDSEADDEDMTRSEYMREVIAHRNDDEELRERIQELETEVERLRNEKRTLVEDRQERQELVTFAEQEKELREMEREKQAAPVWKRAKWWIVGRDVDASE